MENNSSAGGHRESRQHEGCRHPDKALERSEVNIEGFTTMRRLLRNVIVQGSIVVLPSLTSVAVWIFSP